MQTFPASQFVICSWKCLINFVICARPTHDVRDVRKTFVKPKQIPTFWRMSRTPSPISVIEFINLFADPFVFHLRNCGQESEDDPGYDLDDYPEVRHPGHLNRRWGMMSCDQSRGIPPWSLFSSIKTTKEVKVVTKMLSVNTEYKQNGGFPVHIFLSQIVKYCIQNYWSLNFWQICFILSSWTPSKHHL